MARDRTIRSDFWTWEAVIDCAPTARLLFIGLWNFADDHGVQPLWPRTIRLQVFPADPIDEAGVRALIDELAARKLVRIFAVDGVEYLSIVDWELIQRVGRRARHRYPRDPFKPVPQEAAPAPAPPPSPPPTVSPSSPESSGVPGVPPLVARWRRVVGRSLRRFLTNGPPADTEEWIDRWIADGYDLESDVLPAISVACRPDPDRDPPTGLGSVAAYAEANRVRRLTRWLAPETPIRASA